MLCERLTPLLQAGRRAFGAGPLRLAQRQRKLCRFPFESLEPDLTALGQRAELTRLHRELERGVAVAQDTVRREDQDFGARARPGPAARAQPAAGDRDLLLAAPTRPHPARPDQGPLAGGFGVAEGGAGTLCEREPGAPVERLARPQRAAFQALDGAGQGQDAAAPGWGWRQGGGRGCGRAERSGARLGRRRARRAALAARGLAAK